MAEPDRFSSQRADLLAAPATYCEPDLAATGWVATVRLARPVGFLVWDGADGLASWPLRLKDEEPEADVLRGIVRDRLRAEAAVGTNAAETWRILLALVPHAGPVRARLRAVARAL
jgi:hypothetical protein